LPVLRLLGELSREAKIVVLPCPVDINFAVVHRPERALHADCVVDVREDQGDEQNRDSGMYDLRELHLSDPGRDEPFAA
jgi:hypothetical protein